MKKIVIIGAGGCGREVLDVFDACNLVKPEYNVLGFIVQKEYGTPGTIINDKPILGDFDWLETHRAEVYLAHHPQRPDRAFQRHRAVADGDAVAHARQFNNASLELAHEGTVVREPAACPGCD